MIQRILTLEHQNSFFVRQEGQMSWLIRGTENLTQEIDPQNKFFTELTPQKESFLNLKYFLGYIFKCFKMFHSYISSHTLFLPSPCFCFILENHSLSVLSFSWPRLLFLQRLVYVPFPLGGPVSKTRAITNTFLENYLLHFE